MIQPMKKMIRGMILSASALAFVAAPQTAMTVFAQEAAAAAPQCDVEARDKLYNEQFFPNYTTKATADQRKIAYAAAKEYLEKYSNCGGDNKAQVDFIKDKWLPKYEADTKEAAFVKKAEEFNSFVKAKNTSETFRSGRELLAMKPDLTSINYYIVDIGYESAKKKDNTFNNDTIALAKQMIDQINSGKTSSDNTFGPYKSKDDALGWLNYTIGYIMYNQPNQKKDSLAYIYKVTQGNSPLKSTHFPYLYIAEYYLDEYTKAAKEYETNKASTDEALIAKLIGTYKAYADRAIEAYAKAYNVAKADKKEEAAKGIYETLTQFYKARHDGAVTGLDVYVAAQKDKALTDPTTAIVPVIEKTPATTTTGSTSGATSITSSASTAGDPSTNKTAATTKTGTKTTTATASKTTPAKKPAPKKRS